MKAMGNLKSNAIYNPDETRHPPPPALADPENDTELESYIRCKFDSHVDVILLHVAQQNISTRNL